MKIEKNIGKIALVGALALGFVGCNTGLTIEEKADLTGDGIEDIIIISSSNNRYLFIGQKDGSYVRAVESESLTGDAKYFKAKDGKNYFWDGEFYKLSPKQKKE